jgi:hypothetical protein
LSYEIGQYFKVLAHKNQITGGKDELTAGQETAHILAHAILGAAVAAAGGNDALAGGLAAAGAEATAPILSQWLYGKNPADLTADEKATISAIAGLTGAATGVTVGGSMADVAQGNQVGHIAVDNNTVLGDKIREYINDTKRYWHTEKEAKDNLDVIRNVAVNLIGDGLDSVVGLADYGIDSLNALVYCTGVTPDLCNQMQATLDPKNKAALDSIKAVFDTRTYIQFYELLDKAAHGDLQAREAAGELLAAVLITKKVNLNVGKVSKAGKSAGKGANIGKGISNTSTLNPNEIRFSQNTVSYSKTDRVTGSKYTYDDLVTSMKNTGWKGDPVDVVKMPDGKITSMDNTRITAAREAGIDVKATIHDFNEKLTPEIQKSRGWERYNTWGEAIQGRINKQSGGFGKQNPNGSIESPKIKGKK